MKAENEWFVAAAGAQKMVGQVVGREIFSVIEPGRGRGYVDILGE
jgi:hypothetical protein